MYQSYKKRNFKISMQKFLSSITIDPSSRLLLFLMLLYLLQHYVGLLKRKDNNFSISDLVHAVS